MALRSITGGLDPKGCAIVPQLEGRVPPNDEAAEASLVVTMLCMQGPQQLSTIAQVLGLVRAAQFCNRRYRTVFEVIAELHGAGEIVDVATVMSRLRATGRLAELEPGGLPEVLEAAPAAGNVHPYARAIVDAWRMRRVLAEIQRWTEEAYGARPAGTAPMQPAQDLLERIARTASDLAGDAAVFTAQDSAEVAGDAFGYLEAQARLVAAGRTAGVTTGLRALDEHTTGLHAPELTLLGALPSMGKSALLVHVAIAAASAGVGVAFFSLEMTARDLMLRAACSLAGVSFAELRGRSFIAPGRSRALVEAINRLSMLPITWDGLTTKNANAKVPTMLELLAKAERAATARRAKGEPPIGLVVVDYLQRIKGSSTVRGREPTREQVVAESASGLKLLAVRLGVPVLCAAALNRTSARENRRPVMSDIRESGQAEFDADAVWLLHREDFTHERDGSNHVFDGNAEIIVAKQRNGPTGVAHARYERAFMRFSDWGQEGPELFDRHDGGGAR